jgi:serine/threonine protein kinase
MVDPIKIENYEIIKSIGEGSFGKVYLAKEKITE